MKGVQSQGEKVYQTMGMLVFAMVGIFGMFALMLKPITRKGINSNLNKKMYRDDYRNDYRISDIFRIQVEILGGVKTH